MALICSQQLAGQGDAIVVGFRIFAHSVRLVFNNLGQAVRTFGLLYLPIAAAYLLPSLDNGTGGGSRAYFVLGFLAAFGVTVFLLIWMAVAWHRYILLGERLNAFLPPFRRDRWMAYLRRSLLLMLIAFAVAFVGAFAFFFVIAQFESPLLVLLGSLVGSLVFTVIGYRLAPILPASAVDRYLPIGESWDATRDAKWAIVVVAVLSYVAAIILDMAVILFPDMPWLVAGWLIVTGWVKTVVSITILTTIYGHYVEGRPID